MENHLITESETDNPDELLSHVQCDHDYIDDIVNSDYERAIAHVEELGLPRLNGRGSYHVKAVLIRETILQEYEKCRAKWVTLHPEQVAVIFAGCYRLFCRSDVVWWMRVPSRFGMPAGRVFTEATIRRCFVAWA